MSLHVDVARRPGFLHGAAALWSRLTADEPGELHAAAQAIGLPSEWFHARCCQEADCPLWFYDVTETLRWRAVALGAQQVNAERWAELVAARGGQCRVEKRSIALP